MAKKKIQKGKKTGHQKQQTTQQKQKQGEQQRPFQSPYGTKKEW